MKAQAIDNTKKVIADVQALCISAIDLFQKGSGTSIPQDIASLKAKAKELIADEKGMWPELKDLSEAEAGDLGKACFQAVSAVVAKLKKK